MRLIAHTHNEHVVLVNTSTKTELEYHGGYTATWKAEVIEAVDKKTTSENKTKSIVKYTLTLVRPAGDDGSKPISLYNLRLQGRAWGVKITCADPGIRFYSSLSAKEPILYDPIVGGWPIEAAGAGGNAGAKPEKVAMMMWDRDKNKKGSDSTCTIVVFSDRKVVGPLSKPTKNPQAEIDRHNKGPKEGHHSEPPPGTPGGEEGESDN